MNKKRWILASLLAIFVLLLAGCSGGEKTPPVEKEKIVEDLIAEEGTYSVGNIDYKYSYHLPKLLPDQEFAKKINEEIKADLMPVVEDALNAMEINEEIFLSQARYDVFTKDDYVSLLVTMEPFHGPCNYKVYSFDIKNNKMISNEELLKVAGKTEDEFVEDVVRNQVQTFDSKVAETPFQEYFDDYYVEQYYNAVYIQRMELIQNPEMLPLQLHLTEDGFGVLGSIYYSEGYGYAPYDYDLDWGKEKKKDKIEKEAFGYVKARLEDNKLYVSFKKDKKAVSVLEKQFYEDGNPNIKYDKEYEVDGMYNEYEDFLLEPVGKDGNPFIILKTVDGKLEYVDLASGAQYGFWCAIPIPFTYDVEQVYAGTSADVDLETGEDITVPDIIYEMDGSKFEFTSALIVGMNASPNYFQENATLCSDSITHKLDSGGEYSSIYYVEFPSYRCMLFEDVQPEIGTNMVYIGEFTCLGENDEGIMYGFTLQKEDPEGEKETLSGIMAFRLNFENSSKAQLKIIKGDELFDRPNQWVDFTFALG